MLLNQVKDSSKLICWKTDLRSLGREEKKASQFYLQKKPQYYAGSTKTAGQINRISIALTIETTPSKGAAQSCSHVTYFTGFTI